jgi:hypothetical protein
MRTKVSIVCLSIFALLLSLSPSLKSIPGDYWAWYAFISVFAVVPLVAGRGWYRLMGGAALVLSVVLIASDLAAGKRLRAAHPEIQQSR